MAEHALNDVLRVVAFAGSLRRGSFNRALLEAARQLALGRMTISPIEIGELPFYNADVEAEGDPAAVVEFKAAIRAADGVIIATPEYNDGIPGVLTTAIDWGSRPPGIAPLTGKPVALMGASPSQIGTARAQLHLRQLLGHVHARLAGISAALSAAGRTAALNAALMPARRACTCPRSCRRCSWARAVPIWLGDAPISATGFPVSGAMPGGREPQSIAVVSTPGMPSLYSGVAMRMPSAARIAALNSTTAAGSPSASRSAL